VATVCWVLGDWSQFRIETRTQTMWFYREVSFLTKHHSGPPSEWTLLRTRLNKIVSEHHILRISRCQAKNSIRNGRTRYKMTTRWWRATFYTNLKFNREWSTWLKCHLMANWPIKNWLHKIKWTIIIWSAFYNCINCRLKSWNTQEKRLFNRFWTMLRNQLNEILRKVDWL